MLELLLTVAIFTILMLSSAVFYSRFINQNAATTTVDQLTGELRKAQLYAMIGRNFTGSNGGWGVNITSNKMTLYQGTSFASRNSALDESFDINSTITVSGAQDINFAHFTGLPNTSTEISLTGNNTTKTVSINSQGVVSQ